MALWKLSIKNTGMINGVRLEKGMSIEFVTKANTPPLQNVSQNRDQIRQLFMNKYGVDVEKAASISSSRMACEKLS